MDLVLMWEIDLVIKNIEEMDFGTFAGEWLSNKNIKNMEEMDFGTFEGDWLSSEKCGGNEFWDFWGTSNKTNGRNGIRNVFDGDITKI